MPEYQDRTDYRGTVDTVRDAGSELARTARDAGADVARTAHAAGADVAQSAHDAAAQVTRTAKEEAGQVAQTAGDQAVQVVATARQRLRDEVDRQHQEIVGRVGSFAAELNTMAGERPETPAGELVAMLAERSRSFGDYLDAHGPDRVLAELQDFARRRPGTFLAAALAAGFVAGRLGKGLWQNQHESPRS